MLVWNGINFFSAEIFFTFSLPCTKQSLCKLTLSKILLMDGKVKVFRSKMDGRSTTESSGLPWLYLIHFWSSLECCVMFSSCMVTRVLNWIHELIIFKICLLHLGLYISIILALPWNRFRKLKLIESTPYKNSDFHDRIKYWKFY